MLKTMTGLFILYSIFCKYMGCVVMSFYALFDFVLYPFGSTWVHPRFYDVVRIAHLFSSLCCVSYFVCLRPVFCVPVCSGCPFLIAPLVFSTIYHQDFPNFSQLKRESRLIIEQLSPTAVLQFCNVKVVSL